MPGRREPPRAICPVCEAVMNEQGECERCAATEAVRRREEERAEQERMKAMGAFVCVDGCGRPVSREGGPLLAEEENEPG